MIDRPFGDGSALLQLPELRLSDVRSEVLRNVPPWETRLESPGRSMFVFAIGGDFAVTFGDERAERILPQGTAVGFERGSPSVWRGLSPNRDGRSILLVSSIPAKMGVLQRLANGAIIVPHDAEPFATTIRLSAELHAWAFEHGNGNDGQQIIRRCAEIGLIQLTQFAQIRTAEQGGVLPSLVHDRALLRAWAAYYADPKRRWTLKALAEAAGLGRTAFAVRFRDAFGKPPLQTLTEIRLAQAEQMLMETRAPLIEIAFTVGYHSEAAFVRAFHRCYGMPPGRYRAEHPLPRDR